MLYVHEKCKLSDFVFQGNAATYLRCGRILLEIYCSLQQWKNFVNRSRIDKVIAMVRVVPFFWLTVYNDLQLMSNLNETEIVQVYVGLRLIALHIVKLCKN